MTDTGITLPSLEDMGKDREELIAMLADKYEQAVRNSELNEAKEQGIKIGEERGIKILILDNIEEGIAEDRIIAKLQKRYQMTEKEARAAIESYRKSTSEEKV